MVTVIFNTPRDLFHAAAEDFTNRAIATIQEKNIFNVVLSGGETPKYFFDALVNIPFCKEKTPWGKIKFFFGDERYVSSDNAQNNYHTAQEFLFSKVPVLSENIYKISTHFSHPQESVKEYELLLKNIAFDLVYLGLGENAHTASLMPFSDAVMSVTSQRVVAVWIPKDEMFRITLTPVALNNSACIIFLVTGENKASAVYSVLKGPYEPEKYPAQLIHCSNGETIWYLDKAAAKKL